MAMGSFDPRRGPGPMADINVVPLVDVMLVLLVVFIITTPLLTNAVKIDLPKASSAPNVTKPERISFGILKDGTLTWNGAAVTQNEVLARFAAMESRQPKPELHVHADRHAQYEAVAKVMAAAAKSGIVRIGFVTEPDEH